MLTIAHRKSQFGMTLVELMIALLLGVTLSIVIISSYLSTRQTYQTTSALRRMQENARFALHFIKKSARNAGNLGCINRVRNKLADPNYFNLQQPVFGYEYSGTEVDNVVFGLDLIPAVASVSNWHSPIPSVLLNDSILPGSDIVSFKTIEKIEDTPPLSNSNSATQLDTVADHGLDNNSILLVGDCIQSELFKLSGGDANSLAATAGSVPSNIEPSSLSVNWSRNYTSVSGLYRVYETYFFVALNVAGQPSLYQVRHNMHPANNPSREELVEGVETLQVVYGEDTSGDQQPNIYRSSNQVVDWQNIVSVRVGLLLRSKNNISEVLQDKVYTLMGAISFKPKVADKVLRYSVSSTIKNRNRGLQSAYVVCQADFTGCGSI